MTALAGLESLAGMYGIFPQDTSLAGAVAYGKSNAAAAYHNPAALADLTSTDIAVGYLYARPFFRGGIRGDSQTFDDANQVALVGLTLDLGRVFPKDYPVGAGLTMIVDDNFRTLVAFDDKLDADGQFIRYGIHSFMLIGSAGVRIVEGLNVGGGFALTYNASVTLNQNVEITGEIEEEQISLRGNSFFVPIAGIQGKVGPVSMGLVYRGELLNRVDPVDGLSSARISGLEILTYPNDMCFVDGFSPQQVVLGAGAELPESFYLSAQGEWHNWNRFGDDITSCDDPGSNYDLEITDVWVPRIGLSWRPADQWELRTGYAYEPSPFVKLGSGRNLVLDNDRHRVTLGAGYQHQFSVFRIPWSFDLALMYLQLEPRSERTRDGQVLNSRGFLLGASASVTFGF